MLTKAQIQLVQRLQQKKFRQTEQLFLAEGKKIVAELLKSDFELHSIFALPEWISNNYLNPRLAGVEITAVKEPELQKISSLSTPNEVICLTHCKEHALKKENLLGKLSLALCDIQDPGNFGTIIRIADWFGIEYILCSQNTVDIYNPKVIQASMGSFLRVKVIYAELEAILLFAKENQLMSYGAVLQGENLYAAKLSKNGILVLGNESKGISDKLIPFIDKHLTIPCFSANTVDSLNVSVAAAVLCSEFRREM